MTTAPPKVSQKKSPVSIKESFLGGGGGGEEIIPALLKNGEHD